jgi:transcriptional regulator GlxA family with amidase domain
VQIALALYPGFTALDAVGPYQVLANVPGAEVVWCAERAGPVTDDNGLITLDVGASFADVPAPDVLVVPGGVGSRRFGRLGDPLVEWVRAASATATWTTSVCTGALVLAAAGLLDGRPATTHWAFADQLRALGATYTEQRVVIDGSVATAAGVSAGIDLALTLAARLAGPEVAQAIQLGIEYDPQPPFDSGAPAKADSGIRDLVLAVNARAEEAWSPPEPAAG